MMFSKLVGRSVSCAAMGLALTGLAYGQDAGAVVSGAAKAGASATDVTDGAIIRNGDVQAGTAATAETPAVDAGGSSNINAASNGVNSSTTAQVNGNQTNAVQGNVGTQINSGVSANGSQLDANAAVGVSGQQMNSTAEANSNPAVRVQQSGGQQWSGQSAYHSNHGYSAGQPSYHMIGTSGNYSGVASNLGLVGGTSYVAQKYHHARRHHCRHHYRHCCR